MKTVLGGSLVLIALLIHFYLPPLQTRPTLTEAAQPFSTSTENNLQPVKTESRFTEKLIETSETIPRRTIYKDDPDTEAGIDIILEEGSDGKRIIITKITYYNTDTSGMVRQLADNSPEVNQEYSREIVGTETVDPKDKVISRGTKIIWKTLQTPDGEIKYWKKMRVYATHYDSRCPGCNEWTSIGMKQGKGVIAVDPKVIKYRTKVYVPGYGLAIAGDTGGAIKGNIIDLGFEDAKTAGWRAKFVDIYLLD